MAMLNEFWWLSCFQFFAGWIPRFDVQKTSLLKPTQLPHAWAAARSAPLALQPVQFTPTTWPKTGSCWGNSLYWWSPAVFCCWNLHVHYTHPLQSGEIMWNLHLVVTENMRSLIASKSSFRPRSRMEQHCRPPASSPSRCVLRCYITWWLYTVDGRINKWHIIDRQLIDNVSGRIYC